MKMERNCSTRCTVSSSRSSSCCMPSVAGSVCEMKETVVKSELIKTGKVVYFKLHRLLGIEKLQSSSCRFLAAHQIELNDGGRSCCCCCRCSGCYCWLLNEDSLNNHRPLLSLPPVVLRELVIYVIAFIIIL